MDMHTGGWEEEGVGGTVESRLLWGGGKGRGGVLVAEAPSISSSSPPPAPLMAAAT